jgi:hypothetical protein
MTYISSTKSSCNVIDGIRWTPTFRYETLSPDIIIRHVHHVVDGPFFCNDHRPIREIHLYLFENIAQLIAASVKHLHAHIAQYNNPKRWVRQLEQSRNIGSIAIPW